MTIEPDDLNRLVFEVRRFLARTDLMTRLATRSRLYLEFPDVGSMKNAEMAIMRALSPAMRVLTANDNPIITVDEGTVEIEMGGISIMLTCRQRFMTQSGKTVGYRNIDRDAPLKDEQ